MCHVGVRSTAVARGVWGQATPGKLWILWDTVSAQYNDQKIVHQN